MVGSYTASAVGQAAGTLIRIVWYDLQEPRSEFETSCHDNVVLCFRVLRKYLQHLALQFRVPGYSRKKAAPGFRILLKVLKDVPPVVAPLSGTTGKCSSNVTACASSSAILRLPNGSNQATQAGLESCLQLARYL